MPHGDSGCYTDGMAEAASFHASAASPRHDGSYAKEQDGDEGHRMREKIHKKVHMGGTSEEVFHLQHPKNKISDNNAKKLINKIED